MSRYPGEKEAVQLAISTYKGYINQSKSISYILLDISGQLYKFESKTSIFKVDDKSIYKEISEFSKEAAEYLSSNLEYFKKYPQYNIKILEVIIDLLFSISKMDASKVNIHPYIFRAYKFMQEFAGTAIANSLTKESIENNVFSNNRKKIYNSLDNLDRLNLLIKNNFKNTVNDKSAFVNLKDSVSDLMKYIAEVDGLKYMTPFEGDFTNILVYCYKIFHMDNLKDNPRDNLKDAVNRIDYYIKHIRKIADLDYALYS